MGITLTVCPVTYSESNLRALYDRCSVAYRPTSFVSLGMDAMHNALRLTLRNVEAEALAFFKERVPADAMWVEIAPRAAGWFARATDQTPSSRSADIVPYGGTSVCPWTARLLCGYGG